MQVTQPELERARLEPDDLLVVEGHGNPAEIGRVGRWTGAIADCVHQNHLIRVRVDPAKATPVFVERYMNSHLGRRTLLQAANTTSGLNTISTSDVRGVVLPLPPVADQHRFARTVACVDRHRLLQVASSDKLESTFSALQQRAFRGEL